METSREMPTQTITLKTLLGQDIKVTFRTLVSEWDLEQVEHSLISSFTYDEKGKPTVDFKSQGSALITNRQNKQIDTLITKVEGCQYSDDSWATSIKKVISRAEFNKLDEVITSVMNPIDPEQKKSLPNNSSSASQISVQAQSPQNSE